ncbi:MAG: DNA-directed RNA polymerase [Candidatus Burarchaeum sp.]|nr:DNA-directed RNA polymerase [Candidatus Burarchaeum sp.]MDO8340144.1 DNA-directed RNA polymerase [Candidatus Burarchaeum sp.]
MAYMLYTINDVVRIPPSMFSLKLEDAVVQMLREKYERKMDKDLGIIIAVTAARNIGLGKIIPGDGASYHDLKFDVLCFMPDINEVFDGEVSEVVEFGAFVRIGPLDGLVHLSQITNDFLSFDRKSMAFVGRESKKTLKKGDMVRAKVSTVSMKGSIPESKIGMTMRPLGFGKLEWLDAEAKGEVKPIAPRRERKEQKERQSKKKP